MATQSEMPAAAPIAPLGLAGYQEGAVVSRTLLKRAGGTITLFAFAEGQSLSEHRAPFDAGSAPRNQTAWRRGTVSFSVASHRFGPHRRFRLGFRANWFSEPQTAHKLLLGDLHQEEVHEHGRHQ